MPLFVHAMVGALGMNRQAVELSGKTDGKISDVDALLDLAFALEANLADFERDQITQRFEILAKSIADKANDLASLWRWNPPPLRLRGHGVLNHQFVFCLALQPHRCNRFSLRSSFRC